jgi:NDP-sugar pyrophosphorylase family protein
LPFALKGYQADIDGAIRYTGQNYEERGRTTLGYRGEIVNVNEQTDPEVKNYIVEDMEPFESGALPRMVADANLSSYHHSDFWQPMDTLREKQELAKFALAGNPPWLKGI